MTSGLYPRTNGSFKVGRQEGKDDQLRRPTISAVVPARNEASTIGGTIRSLRETLPQGSEIVVVDDGSRDGTAREALAHGPHVRLLKSTGGLGVARARNWGASQSRGDALAFCDAHVVVGAGTWEALVDELGDPRVGAVAPKIVSFDSNQWGCGMRLTSPEMTLDWLHENGAKSDVPHLCGCFTIVRRDTFQDVGGFDGGMPCWGWEDIELSIRLWLLGYDLRVVSAGEVAHLFRPVSPYRIDPVWALHNQLRLAFAHFRDERLQAVLERLQSHPLFARALDLCVHGDVWSRRETLFRHRTRDDDRYFEFGDWLAERTDHGGG